MKVTHFPDKSRSLNIIAVEKITLTSYVIHLLHRYVQFLRNNEYSRFELYAQVMSAPSEKDPSAQPIKPGSLLKYIKMEELLSSAIAKYVFNYLIDDVVNKQQPI